jgi:hypothetical protein
MLAPELALGVSHEGRDEKVHANGAVPPVAVQVVE